MASSSPAAFIIQPDTDGVTNATAAGTLNPKVTFGNGMTGGFGWSVAAAAVGLQPGNSIFGGNSATADQYIFTYAPGTDVDNYSPAQGTDLGNGSSASGAAGGGSGDYNVFVCWPNTANISDNGVTPTDYVATSDGTPVHVGVNQDEDTNGAVVGGVWYKIGVVTLTAGQTYTVTQTAPNSLFTSMRAGGVMWEPVPEPSSLALLAMGGLSMLRRRRA